MTTFLRAHSWLNWVDEEDEVGLKEKAEDTRYIKKTRSTGSVDKGLHPNILSSLGLQTQTSAGASSLRVPMGVLNVLAGGRLQLGLRFWFPPDPRRRCCSTFLNLNWWKGHYYLYKIFLIMVPRVGDGDPSFPVHPINIGEHTT